MKKIIGCLMAVLLLLCLINVSYAACTAECWQYCGTGGSHGYCVDYIDYRFGVGTKQGGNAATWHGTDGLNADNAQANDVAIFAASTANGGAGHVAVIDSIDGDYMILSEWNYGDHLDPAGNTCGKTNKYGTTLSPSRRILKSTAMRFWRPGAGLSNQSTQNPQYRLVGNVAWSPPNKSCHYASMWYFFSQGYPNGGQSLGSNSICQQEEYEMMMALGGIFSNWWRVIYSPVDLVENGFCSQ